MNDYCLQIGYGRTDITPTESVPLAGVGNTSQRMSTVVRDSLLATCVAFTDSQGETALLFNIDLIKANPKITLAVREEILREYGIAPHRVMVSSTHTHSAPDTSNRDIPYIAEYNKMLVRRYLEAAGQALADRKPAKMEIGRAMTERLNFIRHYRLNEEGKPVAHTADPDPQIQMVRIRREGGKDILMMNWQAHPCLSSTLNRTCVSSDYIGEVRTWMEEQTDAHFIFFQGAAGNHNIRSKIKGECPTMDPVQYASLLGERALAALENTTPLAGGKVQSVEKTLTLNMDHSEDHMLESAKIVAAFWRKTNDRKATDAMAKEYGIHSPYHANSIISRHASPATREMTVYAVSVGELGFACAPYEMFCDNGQFIKENSPFPGTFVVSCCNDTHAYLASKLAFDYGCYEKDNRRYPRGTAELLADTFVDLLSQLKKDESSEQFVK